MGCRGQCKCGRMSERSKVGLARRSPLANNRQFLCSILWSAYRLTSSEYFCVLGKHNGLRILKKSANGPDVGGLGLS